ncbi:hypothetical protein ACWD3D_26975, partial [Streptomyces sp. NPDC002690]
MGDCIPAEAVGAALAPAEGDVEVVAEADGEADAVVAEGEAVAEADAEEDGSAGASVAPAVESGTLVVDSGAFSCRAASSPSKTPPRTEAVPIITTTAAATPSATNGRLRRGWTGSGLSAPPPPAEPPPGVGATGGIGPACRTGPRASGGTAGSRIVSTSGIDWYNADTDYSVYGQVLRAVTGENPNR